MCKCFAKYFKKLKQRKSQNKLTSNTSTETESLTQSPKNLQLLNIPLSSASRAYLSSIIESSKIFRALPEDFIPDLLKEFKMMIIEKNKEIQLQHQQIGAFYIISTGQAEIYMNQAYIGDCETGIIIDEIYFLLNAHRRFTVRTRTKCTVWILERFLCSEYLEKTRLQHIDKLQESISKSLLLNCLPDASKLEIIKAASPLIFKKGEIINSEDDDNEFIYIIYSGRVIVTQNTAASQVLSPGDLFGDLFLLNTNKTKKYKAVCKSDSMVFIFTSFTLANILPQNYLEIYVRVVITKLLLSDHLASKIRPDLAKRLVDKFNISHLNEGQIFIQNEKILSKSILVLCDGQVSSTVNSFSGNNLFGFFNKNHLSVGTGKYIALTDCVVAELPISVIEKLSSSPFNKYIEDLRLIADFTIHPFLGLFGEKYIYNLVKNNTLRIFAKNEVIYTENEDGFSFFYIANGSVGIYEDEDFLFRYSENSIFGEGCLISKTRSFTAKALCDVTCFEYSKDQINTMINNKVLDYCNKTISYEATLNLSTLIIDNSIFIYKSREYFISHNAKSSSKYYVEVIYKKKVWSVFIFMLVVDQKCALSHISHPHIPRLIKTLSDSERVLFVYEYFEYITLDWYIPQRLNSLSARFVIINLMIILDYLHSKKILHRNIVPTNIAISSKGYVKLIGFKYIKETKNRSLTVLDTSSLYKAKETLDGLGYSKFSEYWSVGIILYEILTGSLPFNLSYSDSIMIVTEKLTNEELKIPENVDERDCEVIEGLLNKDPKKRFSLEDVVEGPWRDSFSVEDILLENAKSPINSIESGDLFVNNYKSLTRKFSLRETNTTKQSDQNEDLDWDKYF